MSSDLNPETTSTNALHPARKRRWFIWILPICVLLLGGGYLLSQRPASSTDSAAKGGAGKKGKGGGGAIPVSVATVQQGNMGVYINALGTVTSVYTTNVTSRVVGQLTQIFYHEGQMVHKGDLLALIDPRPYDAAYLQAQGQLQRDQAVLSNAQADLARYEAAYAQHAIPEQTLRTQQSTLGQSQAAIKLDQGAVDAAKVNVEYTKITAPIDGRVGLRQVDPGNVVQANGTTSLLTITQLQPITVIFIMAEDYIYDVSTQMRSGHKLEVDAYDRSNQTKLSQGTLITLDNQVDTTTGTVKARASFANRDYRLFPNEFVNARLLVKTLMGVNIIPTDAIQRNNDIAYVYVVNMQAKTVKSRNIKVATIDGLQAAVTGVSPGDTLVTDGFDKLQDNTKISIRPERAPSETQQ
jgi:multidrug efflux system membrane fusion protein